MASWRPLHRRIFAFTVPEKERYEGSMIYKVKSNEGSLSQVQHLWVIRAADDCKNEWKPGERYLVSDGMEFYSEDFSSCYSYEEYKDRPEFASLRAYVESVGGNPKVTLVPELSIQGQVVTA